MELSTLFEKFSTDLLNNVIGGNNVKKKQNPNYPEPLGTDTGLDSKLASRSGNQYSTPKTFNMHKRPPESRGDIEGVANRRPTKIDDPPHEETDKEYNEDEFEQQMAKIFGGKIPRRQTTLATSGGQFFN